MRVLVVAPYYKPAYIYGGPAYSVPQLCQALLLAGAEVTVFTTDANGPRDRLPLPSAEPLDVDGVEVFYFRRNLVWRPTYYYSPELALACIRLMHRFDVAYLTATWTYPLQAAARQAMKRSVPYVLCPRGSYMQEAIRHSYWRKAFYLAVFERQFVDHAAAIHCTSYTEMEETRQVVGPRPIRMIPNCVDLSGIAARPFRGVLRNRLGLRSGDRLCLFAGRLHREKRLDLIIQCFAQVVRRFENVFLAIAGEDYGELQPIRDLIERLNLGQRVFLLGWLGRRELLQAYADADMFVMLSWRENFCMACAEAMAAGLPVLVSERVGLASEIKRARAGFVVSDDQRDIVQVWTDLLSCGVSESLGKNGQVLVDQRFSSRSVGHQMMTLFRDVLQGTVSADASESLEFATCKEQDADNSKLTLLGQ
jgi:glycosyltransferase involved in cell wall biosynthesis